MDESNSRLTCRGCGGRFEGPLVGARWLDGYLVELLESSARARGLPLVIFTQGVARHCGPAERRELDRLLALAAPKVVAA